MNTASISIPDERKMQGLWIPVGVYKLRLSWAKKILCIDVKSMKAYYKSNASIGEFLGCSDRQARRLVAELVEDGWLVVRYENKGTKNELRYLTVSRKFHAAYHEEERPEMATPPADNGRTPRPKMATPPAENGHPVLPVSLTIEDKQIEGETASPTLSLESDRDSKADVLTVKTEFLKLAGRGGRWGAKQTKVAQALLKDFPPDHICDNMKTLKNECVAKRGQYGWGFSMEKLSWKWEEIETIKGADEEEILAEVRRFYPDYKKAVP